MAYGLKDIIAAIESGERTIDVAGLHGSAKAFVLSRLARINPARTIFVITPTSERAEEFAQDFKTLAHPSDIKRLRIFPEFSSLPFSRLSPEPEDIAERLSLLHLLAHNSPNIMIASAKAAMRRVPPMSFITGALRALKTGETVDSIELSSYFLSFGFEDVGLVEDVGTFARRGGIIDVWPPQSDFPVRIELDGDRIHSMRTFDPATQRRKTDITEITIIPARDFPFDEINRKRATALIRTRAEENDLPGRERRALAEALSEGIAFSGIETFLTFFHEHTSTIFDYLPKDALVVIDEANDTELAARAHFKEILDLSQETQGPERIVSPNEIVLDADSLNRLSMKFTRMRWNALARDDSPAAQIETNADIRPQIEGHKAGEDMLGPLMNRINEWRDKKIRIVFTCHTDIQAARLRDLFRRHGLDLAQIEGPFESVFDLSPETPRIKLGRISAGFRWFAERIIIITDEEIFGSKSAKRFTAVRPMEPFTSFAEIAEGDLIVHEQHGIGKYLGLKHLTVEGKPGDYLLIEYLGGDKLYLPVYRLNLVGRYIAEGASLPILDRLGGTRWLKAQKKADSAIRLIAKELLQIYAAREVFPGFAFPACDTSYEEFAAAFSYDETPDQARSIDDIMRDMGIERPMDRLVCGDVGYGKTEVAMRAAFRAVMAGKQVAVLVPTTVLAFQHYDTFTRRFAKTPVAIETLSRFKSRQENKATIAGIKSGTSDIVIGTHRLLQKDVSFRDLGLVIIDEEHRFGVKHKERLKKLRATVDCITLTATPIPRTLNLSLTGIRDISVINTPPANRFSIATYVVPFDDGIIRQAIIKELARGGQVFFVHNRVQTIGSMHDRLKRLIPEARIVIGHGQLKESELEGVMIAFLEKRADVLLCTTIIESGLDIPNANTIIVNRADMMGLAELYQLRGRVGRSNVRASAYLVIPDEDAISAIAKKRLTVLKRFTELGSGFQIAMHDLEFRGAGNLLGSSQSGHVAAVGYEMYTRLLERAIRKLKGAKIEEEIDPELNLKVAAFLPENYIAEPALRIDLYKRLANRDCAEEIAAATEELKDRFGPLPQEAINLLGIMEVKILARSLRIKRITFDGARFGCQMDSQTPLKPEGILRLEKEKDLGMRFIPPDSLIIPAGDTTDDAKVIESAKNSLMMLAGCVSENGKQDN